MKTHDRNLYIQEYILHITQIDTSLKIISGLQFARF